MAQFLLLHRTDERSLMRGDFTLGRSPDCELPLDDEKVSRKHAVLHVGEETLVIEDLRSGNGVSVNGERISMPTPLAHGDRFAIGTHEFQIAEAAERRRRAVKPTVIDPEVSESLAPREDSPADRLERLSAREAEVVRLVALGHTGRQVASELSVSVKTVETYRTRIREKLGLRDKVDIVRFAIDAGLLDK